LKISDIFKYIKGKEAEGKGKTRAWCCFKSGFGNSSERNSILRGEVAIPGRIRP
jgi:hypothetical protein